MFASFPSWKLSLSCTKSLCSRQMNSWVKPQVVKKSNDLFGSYRLINEKKMIPSYCYDPCPRIDLLTAYNSSWTNDLNNYGVDRKWQKRKIIPNDYMWWVQKRLLPPANKNIWR